MSTFLDALMGPTLASAHGPGLGPSRAAQGYDTAPLVSRERITPALRAYHWTPTALDWFLANVDVREDPSLGAGESGYVGPSGGHRAYVYASQTPGDRGWDFTLQHEAEHAWQDQGDRIPGQNTDEAVQALRGLASGSQPIVAGYARDILAQHGQEPSFGAHTNHFLADLLGYDYTLLPDDYDTRWFGFAEKSPGYRLVNGQKLPPWSPTAGVAPSTPAAPAPLGNPFPTRTTPFVPGVSLPADSAGTNAPGGAVPWDAFTPPGAPVIHAHSGGSP